MILSPILPKGLIYIFIFYIKGERCLKKNNTLEIVLG